MAINPNIALQVQPPAPIAPPPSPLDSLAKVLQIKNAMAQQPLIDASVQRAGLENQQLGQQLDSTRVLNEAYKQPGIVIKGPDGTPTIDTNAVSDYLGQNGQGHLIPGMVKTSLELNEAAGKITEQRSKLASEEADYAGLVGARAITKGADGTETADPGVLALGLRHAAELYGPNSPSAQALAALQSDPTKAAAIAFQLRQGSPKQQELTNAATTAGARSRTADVAVAKLPGELKQQDLTAQATEQKVSGTEPIQPVDQRKLAFQQQELDRQLNANLESARHNRVDEGETQRYHNLSVEGVQLTPEAKGKMAEMFASTGVLPNLGMGKAAAQNRSDIINMAAEKFPNVDFATNKASFQANTASLKKLQSQADQTDAFENTAGKNIDVFLSAAKDIVDTGSPLLNRPVRAIADSVFGSEKMAAFKTARETALTEAAKVLESPQGGGALTVSGREAVKTLSDSNATLGAQVQAMKILRQDMANRKQSNVEQIKAITDRIGQANPNNPPPAAAAKPGAITEGTVIVNPTTKERLVLKGGQWVPAP